MKNMLYTSAAVQKAIAMSILICFMLTAKQCAAQSAGPPQTVCQKGNLTTAATGTGHWTALSTNPSVAFIENPASATTGMADFDSVGVYAFKWGTAVGDTLYVTVFVNPNVTPVLDYMGPCHDTLVVHGPAGTVSAGWYNGGNALNVYDTILVATASGPYFAQIYSNVGCVSLLSNTLNVNITSPTVSISPNSFQLHVCYGVAETFTAAATNGGASPSYQWYQDGVPAGTNSPVFVTSTALNDISVQVTSNLPCASPLTTYDEDTFYVYPIPTQPLVELFGSCLANDSLVAMTGGGDTIEWLLNGSTLYQSPYNIPYYIPTLAGMYSAYVTGPNGCRSLVSDSVSITACNSSAGPYQRICLNTTATMAATGTGSWTAFAGNPATTTITNPTSPTTTITGFTVSGTYGYKWGNAVGDTMYVYAASSISPYVTVTSSQASVCSGGTDTLTAIPLYGTGGTSPSYQWTIGGVTIGTNSNVLVITPPLTSFIKFDTVDVLVTSSLTCASPSIGFSYSYWLLVNPEPTTPTISLNGNCLGSDSLVLSGGVFPTQIDWYNGTALVAADSFPPVTVAGGNGVGSADNQFNSPRGIFVDAIGNLYVLDYGNNRVQKFASGSTSLTNGVTVAGGNGRGSAANQFSDPAGIYVDASGNLYVADEENQRVQKFPAGSTSTTNGITVAGGNGMGSAANQFAYPTGVYGDAAGNIYVSDQNNYRVQKFPAGSSSTTSGVTVAGGNGAGNGLNQFDGPQSIFVDINNNIYVNDIYRGVMKFPAGSTSATFGTIVVYEGLNQSQEDGISVYVTSSGAMYVGGGNNQSVLEYPAAGGWTTMGITVAGGNGTGSDEYQFDGVYQCFLDAAGNIYVSDINNSRIQKWPGNSVHSTSYVPATTGNYTATYITANGGCTSAASNTVTVQSCSNATSADTVTICRGSSYTMNNSIGGSNATTYLWIPPTSLSSNAVLNPVASPVVTTEYTLIAIDTNGTVYYDTVLITVDSICTGFVWPGDADDNGIVDNTDLLPIGLTYGFTGTARPQQDINWYAHSATPWAGTNSGGINNAYSDCDGNDSVDVNDVQAILQNYSLTHAKTGAVNAERSGAPVLKMTVTPDTVLNGDTLTCHIILGDGNIPASNVYGVAFTFNYNPIVVDSASVKMFFPDSWLATQGQHITLAKNDNGSGAIYAGLSRIDQTARSGSGEIATVTMVITTDNIDGKNLSYYTDQLGINTVKVINQLGDTIPVNAAGDSVTIGFLPLGISSYAENTVSIKLFPDPANNLAHIRSVGGRMDGLILSDVLGRQVAGYYSINASNFDVPTIDLTPGVYFAQIVIGSNTMVKKFLVQH